MELRCKYLRTLFIFSYYMRWANESILAKLPQAPHRRSSITWSNVITEHEANTQSKMFAITQVVVVLITAILQLKRFFQLFQVVQMLCILKYSCRTSLNTSCILNDNATVEVSKRGLSQQHTSRCTYTARPIDRTDITHVETNWTSVCLSSRALKNLSITQDLNFLFSRSRMA